MVSEAKLRTKWIITSEGKMVSKVVIVLVEANRASGKMCFSEGLGLNINMLLTMFYDFI